MKMADRGGIEDRGWDFLCGFRSEEAFMLLIGRDLAFSFCKARERQGARRNGAKWLIKA
jgi:hypothetical protein